MNTAIHRVGRLWAFTSRSPAKQQQPKTTEAPFSSEYGFPESCSVNSAGAEHRQPQEAGGMEPTPPCWPGCIWACDHSSSPPTGCGPGYFPSHWLALGCLHPGSLICLVSSLWAFQLSELKADPSQRIRNYSETLLHPCVREGCELRENTHRNERQAAHRSRTPGSGRASRSPALQNIPGVSCAQTTLLHCVHPSPHAPLGHTKHCLPCLSTCQPRLLPFRIHPLAALRPPLQISLSTQERAMTTHLLFVAN